MAAFLKAAHFQLSEDSWDDGCWSSTEPPCHLL